MKINNNPNLTKKVYQQPHLKIFGDLRTITQAGRGSTRESVINAFEFWKHKP